MTSRARRKGRNKSKRAQSVYHRIMGVEDESPRNLTWCLVHRRYNDLELEYLREGAEDCKSSGLRFRRNLRGAVRADIWEGHGHPGFEFLKRITEKLDESVRGRPNSGSTGCASCAVTPVRCMLCAVVAQDPIFRHRARFCDRLFL